MKIFAWAVIAALVASQSDEEKVAIVAQTFLKAIKESDGAKAADLLHPRSMEKMKARILGGLEKASPAIRERFAKTLGLEAWPEVEKLTPRDFFAAYLKNAKDLGESARQIMGAVEGMEATVIGMVRKGGLIYVVCETTFTMNGESHTTPSLIVAYKDGEAWKLAFRGEPNIGK